MLLPHSWQNNFVTLAVNNQHLVCTLLHKNHNNTFAIQDFLKVPFDRLELVNATIYNPTFLYATLQQFITQNKITKGYLALTLSGVSVFQQIVVLPHAAPTAKDFYTPATYGSSLEFLYLYPHDIGFAFYLAAIKPHLVTPYLLLSVKVKLHPILVSTPDLVTLNLYKTVHGSSFRHSQLAIDLAAAQNKIDNLISFAQIAPYIHNFPAGCSADDHADIRNAIGLALACQN